MNISNVDMTGEDGVSDIVDVKVVGIKKSRAGYQTINLEFNVLTGVGNKFPDSRDVSFIDIFGKSIILDNEDAAGFEENLFTVNRIVTEKALVLSRVDFDSAVENGTVFFDGETAPTFNLSDDEREWALAFLGNYSLTEYRVGSFRKNLVTAYISADRSNQYSLQEAFPGIKWPAEVCANINGGAELVKKSLGV